MRWAQSSELHYGAQVTPALQFEVNVTDAFRLMAV